jgi:hypothetical protein
MVPGLCWTTFDLTTHLPGDWQEEFAAAVTEADFRTFPRTPILSREEVDLVCISHGVVHVTTRPPELGINPPKPNIPLRLKPRRSDRWDQPDRNAPDWKGGADGQPGVPPDRRGSA